MLIIINVCCELILFYDDYILYSKRMIIYYIRKNYYILKIIIRNNYKTLKRIHFFFEKIVLDIYIVFIVKFVKEKMENNLN